MSEQIIYEQPLNERIRNFLRLEFLFARIDLALQGDSALQNRDAIDGLLNMLSVFERTDLKSELIKELERLITTLSALEHSPGVDKKALDDLLAELDQILDGLHHSQSAIGQGLRDSDFLYNVRQRSSMPGGTCDFDLPAYHFWLQHVPVESRQQQLAEWLNQFAAARAAIEIALRLIRESKGFIDHQAVSGFYQQSLDSNQPNQIIRVQIPKSSNFYPEISGGKHRFTVRFMHFDINQRPQQVSDDVNFSLKCCAM